MIINIPLNILDLHGDGYHPLVNVMVFGREFILVLDTGASKTAFDHDTLLQLGNIAKIKASDRLSIGLGTTSMASSTLIVDNLRIGALQVSEFEVAVLDLSSINMAYRQLNYPEVLGVLGSDILMKYKVVIDFGNKELIFNI